MLTKKSQKVDYADVRPSLQITFQYWRCKILRCFLLTNTSFPFFFTNLHCLLGKIFEYGNFSSLQLLTVSENIYFIFTKRQLGYCCPFFIVRFFPNTMRDITCILHILLVFISSFSSNKS